MPGPPLIVVGASAGGIESLRNLLPRLPRDLPAAVAIVLHRPPVEEDERLPHVLQGGCALPVAHARRGDPIVGGRVYVAPSALHLSVEDGRFELHAGPVENNSRPAIDVLFRTAARTHRRRAAGVILSGMLDDGTAGLAAIVAQGGRAFVQDPKEALFADMPRNAIANVNVDAVLPIADLATALAGFAAMAEHMPEQPEAPPEPSEVTRLACPACGGVLNRIETNGFEHFRCRVGHAYSPRSLMKDQEDALEGALWSALRALEERAELSLRLERRMRLRGYQSSADRFSEQHALAHRRAAIVREVLSDAFEVSDRTPPVGEQPDGKVESS